MGVLLVSVMLIGRGVLPRKKGSKQDTVHYQLMAKTLRPTRPRSKEEFNTVETSMFIQEKRIIDKNPDIHVYLSYQHADFLSLTGPFPTKI